MTRATYEVGQEPQADVGKLTKDRNAEPLPFEFIAGQLTTDIRAGIEAHRQAENARDVGRRQVRASDPWRRDQE